MEYLSANCSETAGAAVNRGAGLVYDTTTTGAEVNVCKPAGALAAGLAGVVEQSNLVGGAVAKLVVVGECYVRSDGSSVIKPGNMLVLADSSGNFKPKPAGAIADPFSASVRAREYGAATAGVLVRAFVNCCGDHYTS